MQWARKSFQLSLFTLVIVVFRLCLVGQAKTKVPEIPPGWSLYPSPDAESEEMQCANYSKVEWEVSIDEGNQLQIRVITEESNVEQKQLPFEIKPYEIAPGSDGPRFLAGRKHVQRVTDGWLVGFDSGEWGGALFWFNRDGSTHRKLIDGAIVGIGTMSRAIVACTFMAASLDGVEGNAYQLIEGDGGWEARHLASIPSGIWLVEPDSDEDSILVLARDGLLRLTLSGEIERLMRTNYDYLYPNSMVRLPSGEVYVGMRHFVTRLVSSGNDWLEQWLVPKDCTRFELDESTGECVCIGQEKKK